MGGEGEQSFMTNDLQNYCCITINDKNILTINKIIYKFLKNFLNKEIFISLFSIFYNLFIYLFLNIIKTIHYIIIY